MKHMTGRKWVVALMLVLSVTTIVVGKPAQAASVVSHSGAQVPSLRSNLVNGSATVAAAPTC